MNVKNVDVIFFCKAKQEHKVIINHFSMLQNNILITTKKVISTFSQETENQQLNPILIYKIFVRRLGGNIFLSF